MSIMEDTSTATTSTTSTPTTKRVPSQNTKRIASKLIRGVLSKQRSAALRKLVREEREKRGLPDPATTGCDKGLHAPWVPTGDDGIATFIQIAQVTDNDVVCDLGCGDARVLIEAAAQRGCRCFGVEFDESMVNRAREEIAKKDESIQQLIDVMHMSVANDEVVERLPTATVVFLFMLPNAINYMHDILIRQLKDGARIVTYTFRLPNVEPDGVFPVGSGVTQLFLYTVSPQLRAQVLGELAARTT